MLGSLSKSTHFKICTCEVCNNLSMVLICTADMKLNWIVIDLFLCFLCSSTCWLHRWEEHDFFDVVGIGQEHCDPIDSASPTSGWWKTIFQSGDVTLIDMLGFEVTSVLSCGLSLEGSKLNLWVVKLCVSVYDFVIVAEQFKSL